MKTKKVVAVDLFCGVGGLSYGLRKAGIKVIAGIDVDPSCEFPFEANNDAKFIKNDIRDVSVASLKALYPPNSIRLLAGCAPCQPFSFFRNKHDKKKRQKGGEWKLLEEFQRLIEGVLPELVTMENVPGLDTKAVFRRFLSALEASGYDVDFRRVHCPKIGIPQHRRRLVLVASRIGLVKVPADVVAAADFRTVRQTIGKLPPLKAGEIDPRDRLHMARGVTLTNLKRLKASRPGGTWRDWPRELRAKCHQKRKGASYQSVYARMKWDEPSPTITTQSHNFGTGRFGHPVQHRSITPREAALLQTFPRRYRFVKPRSPLTMETISRLIGNAVPPRLGFLVGKELVRTASNWSKNKSRMIRRKH